MRLWLLIKNSILILVEIRSLGFWSSNIYKAIELNLSQSLLVSSHLDIYCQYRYGKENHRKLARYTMSNQCNREPIITGILNFEQAFRFICFQSPEIRLTSIPTFSLAVTVDR